MFKQNKLINTNKTELADFIEGQDIFNSLLISEMNRPGIMKTIYTVTTDYRPDLVALEFYGSENYLGILLLQTSPSLSVFKKGTQLKLLPKETIDEIITRL